MPVFRSSFSENSVFSMVFSEVGCFRYRYFREIPRAVFEFLERDLRAFKFRFGNHRAKCQAQSVVQMKRASL